MPKMSTSILSKFDESSSDGATSHIDVKDKKENKSSNPFNGEIAEVDEKFEDSLPEDHPKVDKASYGESP